MNRKLLLLGSVVAIVFISGLVHLFLLRFSSGDVYPYYSSLRADPIGTKALYEALAACSVRVERNYLPFSRIKDRNQSVIIFAGLESSDLNHVPADLAADVNDFVRGGGRLVLTFLPRKTSPEIGEELKNMEEEFDLPTQNLTGEWDFRIKTDESIEPTAELSEQMSLPERLNNHSAIYFANPGKAWRAIYKAGWKVVMMERDFGKGTILIAADSYFLSNEAMVHDRFPTLLSWIVGQKKEVIFDEYHFGIVSGEGVVSLARKYRLEWVALGLFVISLLYAWKSMMPLVPSNQEIEQGSRATGKESAAGLTNLLRKNISSSQILRICFEQWRKTSPLKNEEILKKIQSIAESKDVVQAYNDIRQISSKR